MPTVLEYNTIDYSRRAKLWSQGYWEIPPGLDTSEFDFEWRPDPYDRPYVHQFGTQWQKTGGPRFVIPEAEGVKYQSNQRALRMPDPTLFEVLVDYAIDFDFSWHPDDTEPAYIWTFGNQWYSAEQMPTVKYHVPDATHAKYVRDIQAEILPDRSRWQVLANIDEEAWDWSWVPPAGEPAYIYTWGNQVLTAEQMPTVEYHAPGATDRKFMSDRVARLTTDSKCWHVLHKIDDNTFDWNWVPHPHDPPYVYVWGNQHLSAEQMPTVEYHVPGATERKYMTEGAPQLANNKKCWKILGKIDKESFDWTWTPHPWDPPYVYVWGNQHLNAEQMPTVEYHTPGATERKYMHDRVARLANNRTFWHILHPIDRASFDWDWTPHPYDPPYVYVWGNQHLSAEQMPTVEYRAPGATERKYMTEGNPSLSNEPERWKVLQPINRDTFDWTWTPHPWDPPYIYVWGNQYVASDKMPTVEYHAPGATERKYMTEGNPRLANNPDCWATLHPVDRASFDWTWAPHPYDPPYIYVWGNQYVASDKMPTVEYRVPGAVEYKYMTEGNPRLSNDPKCWHILHPVDRASFDWNWAPHPYDPPYIYVWGNQHLSAEQMPTVEYHAPGATERKYMNDSVAQLVGNADCWKILLNVHKESFDWTWSPHPWDPPFIYVWGNQWNDAATEPTVEYHVPGATERKYMYDRVVYVAENHDCWKVLVTGAKLDFSWRPNPHSPPYIYVWGNQWNTAVDEPTVEYHVPGATERKYMDNVSAIVPRDNANWKILVAGVNYDFSWRPNPHSPPYIYVWGNQWNDAATEPTLEYHVPDAVQRKYMDEVIVLPPDANKFQVHVTGATMDFSWRPNPHSPPYRYVWGNQWNDAATEPTISYTVTGATETKFMDKVAAVPATTDNWKVIVPGATMDFSWRPNPHSPPYIYVWGNQWNEVRVEPTVEYHAPGATERKYMTDSVAKVPNDMTNWKVLVPGATMDFSWRPDPREPAYIYVWGNQWNDAATEPTVEYHVPGATERKYMNNTVAQVPESQDNWKILIPGATHDFSWRPNPHSPPYIYTWGHKWCPVELEPAVEYHVPGATERKYMTDALVQLAETQTNWRVLIPGVKFDWTWRPDPREPALIYVWGNQWNDAVTEPTVEYHVPGAVDRKYISSAHATVPARRKNWNVVIPGATVDFSWRPNPHSPPYIYTWGHKWCPVELEPAVEYHVPGATERKYMTDQVTKLADNKTNWRVLIPGVKFDWTWRPDPREPAYIYVWGHKWCPVELEPALEYHVPGATERKYMTDDVVQLPENKDRWRVLIPGVKFDWTWRPDPREPAYIYTWGHKWCPVELEPAIEYHVPGATERKYMHDQVAELAPDKTNWRELIPGAKFDWTWRPDPREPAYIYTWGHKWCSVELEPAVEYHVPGATERKYMHDQVVELAPDKTNWRELIPGVKFDWTWRPDPREPAYIYTWGHKWCSVELEPAVEYHVPGATERKYMHDQVVELAPDKTRWTTLIPGAKFDWTWRPDPREPAYIYTWGHKWCPVELEPALEYHVPGATERKYMHDQVAELAPDKTRWTTLIPGAKFDWTWRPDPREPAYIYTWGHKWCPVELEPALEYHVPGATERKYMHDQVAELAPDMKHWKLYMNGASFDWTWRPDPREPAYIYVWGTKWNPPELEPAIEYHVPGATERKYMHDQVVNFNRPSENWRVLISGAQFDHTWRPDPREPAYIYVWGNQWNDAATEPTVEYHVPGASDRKYMADWVAQVPACMDNWTVSNAQDLETFDFSWRPNPHSPAQIYQWENNGPRYTVPGATDVVLMERTSQNQKSVIPRYYIETTLEDLIYEHPEEVFWAISPRLDYTKFDFDWKPDTTNFRHINVFGNKLSRDTQTYYVNGPMYMMGHRALNYITQAELTEEQDLEITQTVILDMFYVDMNTGDDTTRFKELQNRFPTIQKIRYLNSWRDTILRCVKKASTKFVWVLNSRCDYSEFEFDWYPADWQANMVHVFGTQWSHWGNTYLVNAETFAEDTKYIEVVEHLKNINHVKNRRIPVIGCAHDILFIDFGNSGSSTVKQQLQSQTKKVYEIKYDTSYLQTLKNWLRDNPALAHKRDYCVWVTNSVADYNGFDWSWHSDPFQREQLHVFASEYNGVKQKFGDTLFVNVSALMTVIDTLGQLENYPGRVNYIGHIVSGRQQHPVVKHTCDSQAVALSQMPQRDWPYYELVDERASPHRVPAVTPSVWGSKHATVTVTTTGATHVWVPDQAIDVVKNEIYDYPEIAKLPNLVRSQPLDIVFISNGEPIADENYSHLIKVCAERGVPNRIVRVSNVNGRVASQHAAAREAETAWYFLVNGKVRVRDDFDWSWQPDRLQQPKHYIFTVTNPVNGLEYGHQAIVANNRDLTLNTVVRGLDFTLDSLHEVVEINCGVAVYNTDAWTAWRTAFRESIKLRSNTDEQSRDRLRGWLMTGAGDYADWSQRGAQDGVQYWESVNGDLDKLRKSYDWDWIQEYYKAKYGN